MKAGFARVSITPPPGTGMMGFADRDIDHGCEGVHDDIFARALYLAHGGSCYTTIIEVEPAVIFCQVDGWFFRVALSPPQI